MTQETPLQQHIRQLEQARKAFLQNPTPSLGHSIQRLERAITYQKRAEKKKAQHPKV